MKNASRAWPNPVTNLEYIRGSQQHLLLKSMRVQPVKGWKKTKTKSWLFGLSPVYPKPGMLQNHHELHLQSDERSRHLIWVSMAKFGLPSEITVSCQNLCNVLKMFQVWLARSQKNPQVPTWAFLLLLPPKVNAHSCSSAAWTEALARTTLQCQNSPWVKRWIYTHEYPQGAGGGARTRHKPVWDPLCTCYSW